MVAKNEILPLDAAGPSRNTITAPLPLPAVPGKASPRALSRHSEASNADALSAQERRIRLVALQRRHTSFQLFYGFFGIALMVVQMEYLWFANTRDFTGTCQIDSATECPMCLDSLAHSVPNQDGRMLLHALRVLITFSTIILLYYVYAFYSAECSVLKIKNIVPPKATLLSSPLRYRLIFELLLFVVHPFPGLETIDPRWPDLVVTTSLVMFSRVFLLFRVVQFRSSFNSSNGWFIGSLTNVDFTTSFFLKSTLKNHPSKCILVSFTLLLLITGYSLYVVERFLCAFVADSCCTPLLFVDAIWALVITMLTIGYGDVVPHTGAGRFFAVLAGLFGTVLTAVTIAVMSSYLVLTRSEHKVNAFLKKDENRRLINDHAARAIQAYVNLRAVQRRFHGVKSDRGVVMIAKAEHKLYDVLRVYRQVKRFVNSHDVSDPMDKQMTMLEMMEVNVEYIRTKIEDLGELFQTQADKQAKSKRKMTTSPSAATATMMTTAAAPSTGSAMATAAPVVDDVPTNETHPVGASGGAPPAGNTHATTAAPATTSMNGTGSPPSSSSGLVDRFRRSSAVPGQAIIDDFDADDDDVGGGGSSSSSHLRITKPEPTSEIMASMRRPSAQPMGAQQSSGSAQPGSSSHTQQRLVEMSEIPEWAIAMETTMQAILMHVSRVSDEMETLRSKVQDQMDTLQGRMGDLEKKLGVQDAFREIARGTSTRKILLHRQSSTGLATDNGDQNSHAAGAGGGAGSGTGPSESSGHVGGSNGGNGSFSLGALTRSSRMSFSTKKPSIHNFVTPKDLEEFQNSGIHD